MTDALDPPGFSLVDEAWIPVLDTCGHHRDVSLLELFTQATDIRMIACALPTQTFALLRLALTVLHRATAGPPGEAAWQHLWRSPDLPVPDIAGYLRDHQDRFDLLHPTTPFYQVADLTAGNKHTFGLERLIADVPNGMPFLTSRAGPGLARITPAEAGRWVVHCQSYDPAGIKTGAVGDPQAKGGKRFPMGVAPLGAMGGVYLQGANLRETLLLNLLPVAPGWRGGDERDRPAWERPPLTAAAEPSMSQGPPGLLGLYTWQARRIRLYGDRHAITGAMIAYGDPLDLQDRHLMEPMSGWRRNLTREQKQNRVPVYLPSPHDPHRPVWHNLPHLLPPPQPASGGPSPRLAPLLMRWLAHLTHHRMVDEHMRVRVCAVGVTYGTQQAVIDEVFGDHLSLIVRLVADPGLYETAVGAVTAADTAVGALRTLAANLVRAAGGPAASTGEADRATEHGYALLHRPLRDWLAELGPATEPAVARAQWQQLVWRAIAEVGADLIAQAGASAWAGRAVADEPGRKTHYSSSRAEAGFRTMLSTALPMACPRTGAAS